MCILMKLPEVFAENVCRLATELRAPCPVPEDTHLLILQQLFAFVV